MRRSRDLPVYLAILNGTEARISFITYSKKYEPLSAAKADAETWNKPFFATDCARKALVFKKAYASEEDIPLSVVGCGRWDCLPCSAHKARLFVMYLTDVTKDWEHMMMWTFTVRHDDTMDRNVHKKVLFTAFACLFHTITDSHGYHQRHKNFRHKDNSCVLNGARPNLRFIRVNERHRNGFLHIHALVDTYLPHDTVYEKFNNLAETYAKKFNLLEGCSEEFIEKWNHQYLWLASSASDGHWLRKPKKDLAVFRKLNGSVHVLMAKATKEPSASLHKYISKMSSGDIGMKIANIKEYRRRVVAIQLSSYLSKKDDRREKAVELTLQYPYPNMKYFSTRAKLVKSMEKWKTEKATGEWKLIGFGKPGENILEPGNFAPTADAYTTEEIPPELVRAIPDHWRPQWNYGKEYPGMSHNAKSQILQMTNF